MSRLLETIENIQETQAAIHRLEAVVTQHPDEYGMVLNLKSMLKRQRELERIFAELTHKEYMDVCSYRIFGIKPQMRPGMPTVTHILSQFQDLFTLVYAAIKSGKQKMRDVVTAEIAQGTEFGFAYSFTGSIGFVLTLPNERLLLDKTNIDITIETVFDMMKADTTEKLLDFAHKLGPAPIRSMYKLVEDHINSGTGADIDWLREKDVRSSLFIQIQELEILKEKISKISDEEEEEIILTGSLVGADVDTLTFHMKFEDGLPIRGKMSESIGIKYESVKLPERYTARIQKKTITSYSTGEEKVSYLLLGFID